MCGFITFFNSHVLKIAQFGGATTSLVSKRKKVSLQSQRSYSQLFQVGILELDCNATSSSMGEKTPKKWLYCPMASLRKSSCDFIRLLPFILWLLFRCILFACFSLFEIIRIPKRLLGLSSSWDTMRTKFVRNLFAPLGWRKRICNDISREKC